MLQYPHYILVKYEQNDNISSEIIHRKHNINRNYNNDHKDFPLRLQPGQYQLAHVFLQ